LGYDCPENVVEGATDVEMRTLARALNLARREFTTAQKEDLIADQLQETPGASNRKIAKELGVSHPTVGRVRAELERTGKIFQFEQTVGEDGKARPSKKAKRVFQNPPELRRPYDFYPTPPHATTSLLEREKFTGLILEPACGAGAVVQVLRQHGHVVEATDLVHGQDFFAPRGAVPNIITNPPYRCCLEFIYRAKEIARKKIALLLPVEFLHGVSRYELFQDERFPLKAVYVFSSRLRFGTDTDATVGHAWYVWQRGYPGQATLGWIK
jgi:hypothetical protein